MCTNGTTVQYELFYEYRNNSTEVLVLLLRTSEQNHNNNKNLPATRLIDCSSRCLLLPLAVVAVVVVALYCCMQDGLTR